MIDYPPFFNYAFWLDVSKLYARWLGESKDLYKIRGQKFSINSLIKKKKKIQSTKGESNFWPKKKKGESN